MDILKTTIIRKGRVRCVWVHDPHYESGHDCGTPEESAACLTEELTNLESGKWAALGCILQKRCTHCDEWRDVDDLWGIVIEPTDAALKEFALGNMDFSKRIKR